MTDRLPPATPEQNFVPDPRVFRPSDKGWVGAYVRNEEICDGLNVEMNVTAMGKNGESNINALDCVGAKMVIRFPPPRDSKARSDRVVAHHFIEEIQKKFPLHNIDMPPWQVLLANLDKPGASYHPVTNPDSPPAQWQADGRDVGNIALNKLELELEFHGLDGKELQNKVLAAMMTITRSLEKSANAKDWRDELLKKRLKLDGKAPDFSPN